MDRFLSQKRVLMLADGEKPSLELFHRHREGSELLIALDGAAHWLIKNHITPDLIIGDMDSADTKEMGAIKIRRSEDQNSNDLAKALSYCQKNGHREISLLGAFGARADHFLTNLYVVKRLAKGMMITMVDDRQFAFICPTDRIVLIDDLVGRYISLFPLADRCGPITSTGVKYPLNKEFLGLDDRIGTLNQVVSPDASLRCGSDGLLVILESKE